MLAARSGQGRREAAGGDEARDAGEVVAVLDVLKLIKCICSGVEAGE